MNLSFNAKSKRLVNEKKNLNINLLTLIPEINSKIANYKLTLRGKINHNKEVTTPIALYTLLN